MEASRSVESRDCARCSSSTAAAAILPLLRLAASTEAAPRPRPFRARGMLGTAVPAGGRRNERQVRRGGVGGGVG